MLDLDRGLIQELQDEGLVNRERAVHLEEALRSSRRIGAAIGIVMANRRVSEDVAFEMLSRASQNVNPPSFASWRRTSSAAVTQLA